MRASEHSATKPPYVLMQCPNCGTRYKIGPTRVEYAGDHPYCDKDYMPLATIKAVAR
jgi:hypothetical protein